MADRTKRTTLLTVFILVFGIIVFFHESCLGKWIDNGVYESTYVSESFITTPILSGATKIGEVWVMVCLSLMPIAYLMLKRCKIEALFFVITMSLSGILNPLLKDIFDREHPTLLRLIDISGFSFPSGHTMGSISSSGSAMYIAQHRASGSTKGIIIGLRVALILLTSISRVYLGVYYPTDTTAGIIGGAFCIVLPTLVLKGLYETTIL